MNTETLILTAIMAVAELGGAALFIATKDGVRRAILACFGLGFALCIVIADIIPDATENNPWGWGLIAVGAVLAGALMFKAGQRGSGIGNGAAIAGMGLHNLCEGIVLAASGPLLTPLVFVGAVAHKLPEGMVVFSLADRLSLGARWVLAALLSLLIPLGLMISLPEEIEQGVLPLAAGVLLVVLAKALALTALGSNSARAVNPGRRAAAGAAMAGAVVAGLTCLVI